MISRHDSTKYERSFKYDSAMACFIDSTYEVSDEDESASSWSGDYVALMGRRVYFQDSLGFVSVTRFDDQDKARVEFERLAESIGARSAEDDDEADDDPEPVELVTPDHAHVGPYERDCLVCGETWDSARHYTPGGLRDELVQSERELGTW